MLNEIYWPSHHHSHRHGPWDAGVIWHSELVSPPIDDPVSLTVVRDQHLRVPSSQSGDEYIQRLIRVTRRMGERATRRSWLPQTWQLVMDRFPYLLMELPRPPLITVESITYIDGEGIEQTLSVPAYQVSAPQGPTCRKGWVAPAPLTCWPIARFGLIEAVTVTYQAGYAAADGQAPEDAIPEDLVQGQLLVIEEMYRQRAESVTTPGVTVSKAFRTARDIWLEYRVP